MPGAGRKQRRVSVPAPLGRGKSRPVWRLFPGFCRGPVFLEYAFTELGKVRSLTEINSQFQRRFEAGKTFCCFQEPLWPKPGIAASLLPDLVWILLNADLAEG